MSEIMKSNQGSKKALHNFKKELFEKFISKGTIVICILAVVFSVLSISATWRMKETASSIYQHPYTVSNSSRMMRSRLLDMKRFIGIFLTEGFNSVEETMELLQDRYDMQKKSLDVVKKEYLGPKEDTERLEELLNALIDAQEEAVYYAENHTDQEVHEYLEEYIYPRYDDLNDGITVVVDFADSKVQQLEQKAAYMARISTLTAVLMTVFIILLTIYNNRLMARKRKHDVADREKMFDLLSQSVDEVFFIYDLRKQEMEYISNNCERLLYQTEEEIKADNRAIYSLIREEDVEAFNKFFGGGIIRNQSEYDFVLNPPNGEASHWMNLRVYPIIVDDIVTRYIICIADQTERMLVQQNLKDALSSAQSANEAKQNFMSRMSHEIRTPMNAIIGMTTIAAANIHDEERVEDCLSKIAFSSRHLLSLINDVLDVSKIEEGKLTISKEPFELRQLMESVTSIIYSQARAQGLNFDATIIDFMDERLLGDALRVNQILLNLLSNAVKFTPQGGNVRLEVRQVAVRHGKVRLRFTVSDTGVGMKPEFLKRLYLPFEQADAKTAQRYGGTGLGMAITKNLVTLLGGTIQVSSKVNEGTTFQVELPFERVNEPEELEKKQALENLKVLLVDDDQDTCIHTSLLLDKLGIEAKWVLSGSEAIDLVLAAHEKYQDYDVCFIDWQMPDLDGIETTRRIREYVGPDTLIIIISAYDWHSIEKLAIEAGANAFISKPMFASTIYNTLLSVTGEKHQNLKLEESLQKEFDFKGNRVLLAEDNELNGEIATELLKMVNMEVETAHNGQEAVDMLLSSEPGYYDLVLMDIQMPVMNGHQAARVIRNSEHPDARRIPIIAMTANAFSEDVSAALESGMNGHIAKPIDTSILYHTLYSMLGIEKPVDATGV